MAATKPEGEKLPIKVKLLFLDIDGVLNSHKPHANGYCGLDPEPVAQFNRILEAVPDLQVVISSSWRYLVLNGDCTLRGFEHMLQTHGLNCRGRLHGVCGPDPMTYDPKEHVGPFDVEEWKRRGLEWRAEQIANVLWKCDDDRQPRCEAWAVLDDLPLDIANLFQTDPTVGLTPEIAGAVVGRFEEEK